MLQGLPASLLIGKLSKTWSYEVAISLEYTGILSILFSPCSVLRMPRDWHETSWHSKCLLHSLCGFTWFSYGLPGLRHSNCGSRAGKTRDAAKWPFSLEPFVSFSWLEMKTDTGVGFFCKSNIPCMFFSLPLSSDYERWSVWERRIHEFGILTLVNDHFHQVFPIISWFVTHGWWRGRTRNLDPEEDASD